MIFTECLLNGQNSTICLTEDGANFTIGGQRQEEMIWTKQSFMKNKMS